MPNDLRAQVRAINDLYRTALMNRKYYACRLKTFRMWNKAFEIAIAIGSSSAVAGWGVWKLTKAGGTAWGILAAAAALAAVLKPILQLPKEIERYSKLHIGYCSLYYDLDTIVFDLQHLKELSPTTWKTFLQIRKRNNELGLEDDPNPKQGLLAKCQAEVIRELPKGHLWLPEKPGESGNSAETAAVT